MSSAFSDPLIGRDREFEQLRRLLRAAHHGTPATAFIEGEAGSGRALDHAGACEDAAAVLAGHDHRERARSLLGEAIDRYEALGATRLTSRATARLRELGGRRGSRGGRQRP